MSEAIRGTFKLRPVGEGDKPLLLDLSGPLSFAEAVTALINDYGAHPQIATSIVVRARIEGENMFKNPLTRQTVQVIYLNNR